MRRSIVGFTGLMTIFGIVFVFVANAAPTVKKLGTNSGNTVKTTNLPTKSSNTSRIGSIRSTKLTNVKPVTVTKTTATKSVDDSEQRLSIGKYIHPTGVTSGVIKPIASAESAVAASNDIVSLNDRVEELAKTVDNKQDILDSNNVISSGNGIIVTAVEANAGKVVINKDEITVPVGEPGATKRAFVWVE